MYIEYNSNPENKLVGDCVVRAISKVTDQDWERTYMEVCVQGFMKNIMGNKIILIPHFLI